MKKQPIPNRIRTAVCLRDKGICQNCGKIGKMFCNKTKSVCVAYEKAKSHHSIGMGGATKNGVAFETGHIIPESKGGKLIMENLILLCRECNRSMGTQIYAI